MPRELRIRLLGWSIFLVLAAWFLLAGWPLWSLALAQDAAPLVATTPAPVPVTADPLAAALLALLQGGGLPAVLALVAWWARGSMVHGVPVTVRLSDDDRKLLERAIRVLDRGRRDLAGALSEATEDRPRGLSDDDSVDQS